MIFAAVQVDDEPRKFACDVEIGMQPADEPAIDSISADVVSAVGFEDFFRNIHEESRHGVACVLAGNDECREFLFHALFLFHDEDVPVVGHDSEEDAMDEPELVDLVVGAVCHGVGAVGVGYEELLLLVEPVEDHEMPHGVAVDVVENGLVLVVGILAGAAVEVGGAEPAEDGNVALEVVLEHARAQIGRRDGPAQIQEADIGFDGLA